MITLSKELETEIKEKFKEFHHNVQYVDATKQALVNEDLLKKAGWVRVEKYNALKDHLDLWSTRMGFENITL